MSRQDEDNSVKHYPSEKSDNDIPPPDGGIKAWLHVLYMHLVFFNTWGVTNSFGVFQVYYTSTLLADHSPSSISWIGSVQMFLLFFAGVFAGRVTDAGYFRAVFLSGVVLQLVGTFLTSLAKTYWEVFLSQALCVGLGHGLVFTPSLSVMSTYFQRHRAFAVGLAAAGAATGGLVYPAVVNALLYDSGVGFPWTIRIVGFIMLVTHLPPIIGFRVRLPPRQAGPVIDWSAFCEKPFVFFTIGMFLNFWGFYLVFFYLGTFARDRIGVSDSITLLMVLNGVGIVGRTVPNLIGDRVTGMLNILIPVSLAASLLVYCWAAVETVAGLYAFAVVYGIIVAAAQALFPANATMMAPHINRTGTRTGMILTIVSLATLTGPAIDGALVQREGGQYLGAQVFAASSILVGACSLVIARITKVGWKLIVKV